MSDKYRDAIEQWVELMLALLMLLVIVYYGILPYIWRRR